MKRPIFSIFTIVSVAMAMICSLALFIACDDDDEYDEDLTEIVDDNSSDYDSDNSSNSNNKISATDTINGYECVDLGLSVKWAMCNIGASNNFPTEYGSYFAWGETDAKSKFTAFNSKTYEDEDMEDFSGNATYDAATANWGSTWRMPTSYECEELIDNCTWEWGTYLYEYIYSTGYVVTGPSGNSIFLPAGGISGNTYIIKGEYGRYWSSSPDDSDSKVAYGLDFDDSDPYVGGNVRYCGLCIRPVSE